MPDGIRTGVTAGCETKVDAARLVLWFSPGFPTGAFGFSHGLEWAVEAGDVSDRDSLIAWIAALLEHGSGWSDAVLLGVSYRALRAGDRSGLIEAAELAAALQPSSERRLETTVQGEAFLKAVETGWPSEGVAGFRAAWKGPVALPIAVGVASASVGLPLQETLAAFLAGFAANLVSAAIRLAPIGQSDGLRTVAAMEPLIAWLAPKAASAGLDQLGTFALRSDIASMRHETQFSRLFRS